MEKQLNEFSTCIFSLSKLPRLVFPNVSSNLRLMQAVDPIYTSEKSAVVINHLSLQEYI